MAGIVGPHQTRILSGTELPGTCREGDLFFLKSDGVGGWYRATAPDTWLLYEPQPPAHSHGESDVTGLVSDLASKATPAEISTAISDHQGASDPHAEYQKESEKGAANGYASLGATALVPMSQLATGTPDGTKFVRDDGTLQVAGGGGPHAATHQHSGGDEVATATPAANAIPKAGAGATLASGWIPDLSSTYAVAAKGVTNGDTHDHLGGDGATIDHVNLSSKGTNTHAQIDTHLGAAAPHSGHEQTANKGAVSGYAGLGANSIVPTAQLGTGAASGTTFLRGDQTWATPAGGSPFKRAEIAVPVLAALVWTNMPAALSFWLSSATVAKGVTKIDLTGFTQVRLLVNKQGTAGAAASKLILRYKVSPFTQTVANYSDIGTSEVSVAVNVTNTFLETAWINLVAGAKADVFLALVGSGGDGVIDPAFGLVAAEFK